MEISTGTATATGAAMNIVCGFKPSWVDLYNITTDIVIHWIQGMGDGKGFKILGGGADINELIASGGITPATHADGTVGFIIGTDSVNVNTNALVWKAGH